MNIWLLYCVVIIVTCNGFKVVRFPGGGIYFWWQAGAATYLMETQKVDNLPLMGASSGSIVASLMALNLSFEDAAKLAIKLGLDNSIWDNKSGLSGIWGAMVKEFLREMIPNQIPSQSLNRVNILVTPTLLLKGPVLLNNFHSKGDLIDAVMASIHIPMFMDGRISTSYQGKQYIDGSFWSQIAKVQGPFPTKNLNKKLDVFHVDYKNDRTFTKVWGRTPITKLISPADVYTMMERGYKYMEALDRKGALFPNT